MSQIICGYLKLSERGGLNAAVFPAKRLDGPTIQKKHRLRCQVLSTSTLVGIALSKVLNGPS